MKTFEELGVSEEIRRAIEELGFVHPMPVQEEVIPYLLGNRNDVIALAQTGTGKTAAFGIPVLQRIDPSSKETQALVLSPTRELCLQIADDLRDFSKHMEGIHIVAVYGGASIENQIRQLRHGAQIIVATPGRLISHLSLGYVDLSRVSFFILDEADRMLDMGFYDDIMQIVKFLPKERQTIMFSATMPAKIQQLAQSILNNPVEVKLAVSKPAEKIIQAAYMCYEHQKLGIIQSLFKNQAPERVIVFASKKLKVKEVAQAFHRMGLNVGEMHSDLEQAQREQIMREFKNGHVNILVATDIVSRGIDIDDIRLVINYDVPNDCEDYVHRIGRTARANNDGCAITFVSEKEQTPFKTIEDFLEKTIYKIPVPEELGEAPAYNPKKTENKNKRKYTGKGKKYSGNRNGNRKKNGGNEGK